MGNIKTQKLVDDIKSVAKKLGRSKLSRSEYLQYGNYSYYQIYDGGNDWSALCSRAGIKSMSKEAVSDKVYFLRLAKAFEQLGRNPKSSERKKFGLNFSKSRFSTLTDFIEKAIELGYIKNLNYKSKVNQPPSASS